MAGRTALRNLPGGRRDAAKPPMEVDTLPTGRKRRPDEHAEEHSQAHLQSCLGPAAGSTARGTGSSLGFATAGAAGSTALIQGAGDQPDHRDVRDIAALLMGFGANPSAVDVAGVFSPGRLAEHAHLFGLTPGLAADLRTGWDLSTQEGQRECWKHLEREDPYFILGSPMCKASSVLQSFNKGSENYQVTLKHGLNHLTFCMDVCAWQASRGKFLQEHPWSATSWKLDFVQSRGNAGRGGKKGTPMSFRPEV